MNKQSKKEEIQTERTVLENHENCPNCNNQTVSKLRIDSAINGRRCSTCGVIVNNRGEIEKDS
jgi:transcription elongation factor Elf1